jgi:hypothetical protein
MDTNDLVAYARARFDHEANKRLLQEKYEAKLTFAYKGGMFRADPAMIAFLSLYGDEPIVIQDLYHNPVQINAQELRTLMMQRHQEQMNAWLNEHSQSSRNR